MKHEEKRNKIAKDMLPDPGETTDEELGQLFPGGVSKGSPKGVFEQLVFSGESRSTSAYREVQLGLQDLRDKKRQLEQSKQMNPSQ